MPVTLQTALTAVRERLDEAGAVYWQDRELQRWLNEGCREIARKTEALRDTADIAATAGVGVYNTPADVLRIHRLEYTMTGNNTIYPLESTTVNHAEAMGWVNQDSQGIPYIFFTWGFAGADGTPQLYVFPKPTANGNLKVWYYRTPSEPTGQTDTFEIPQGWEDVIYAYCEYKARMRDGDQQWQAAKMEYQEKLDEMIVLTRDMSDAPTHITQGTSSYGPWWFDGAGEGGGW
jgi:hypothetical protein